MTSSTGVAVVQETVSAEVTEENEDAERVEGLEGTLTKVVVSVVDEMGAGIMVMGWTEKLELELELERGLGIRGVDVNYQLICFGATEQSTEGYEIKKKEKMKKKVSGWTF